MRAKTKPGGARALSDSTIRSTYTVLRAGLDGAVRDGLLARNPAALVKRPGVPRSEAKHLDAGDVAAVLAAARGFALPPRAGADRVDRVAQGRGVGAVVGPGRPGRRRRCGSRRRSARIGDRLVISEPKTDRARRTVPLSPAVVAMLRRHRTEQKAEKLRAGDQWTETGLVFTTELGAPVDPRNFLRVIEGAAKAAGVEGVGVHTLRHSAAVSWLEAGVHIKAVADLLGHSSIAITGDVYGHTCDDTARAAVDGLSSALGYNGRLRETDRSRHGVGTIDNLAKLRRCCSLPAGPDRRRARARTGGGKAIPRG